MQSEQRNCRGVTKLLFEQCLITAEQAGLTLNPGVGILIYCNIAGVDEDDSASASLNDSSPCMEVVRATPDAGKVTVQIKNNCSNGSFIGLGASIAVIVFDK